MFNKVYNFKRLIKLVHTQKTTVWRNYSIYLVFVKTDCCTLSFIKAVHKYIIYKCYVFMNIQVSIRVCHIPVISIYLSTSTRNRYYTKIDHRLRNGGNKVASVKCEIDKMRIQSHGEDRPFFKYPSLCIFAHLKISASLLTIPTDWKCFI